MRPLLSSIQEPQIVLTWLTRLRWFAVAGQVAATAVAVKGLGLDLPLAPIAIIVAATVLTNLAVYAWMRRGEPAAARSLAMLVPALILLDVCLLTALLYFTGGAHNPFATLYVVHVVMAVVVLGPGWAWVVMVLASAGYALLFPFHNALIPTAAALDRRVMHAGSWLALVLELALIAYFVSRLARSLREREQELLATRDRATRNEQLATLTTLAAGAAHELGTPLGTIAVVAKELELAIQQSTDQPDGDMAEDARLIRREVDRCRKILDRMRVDIVKDIAQSARSVTVEELLEQVRQDFPEEDRARLVIRHEPEARAIFAPLRAVQQALGVMIRNAFDASPPDAAVGVHVFRRNEVVVLEVVDRGSGMPAEVVKRAGNPFFTTKDPGKGMGLGLFLVRLVAERCNGRWYLESTPGEGTLSVLELPADPSAG